MSAGGEIGEERGGGDDLYDAAPCGLLTTRGGTITHANRTACAWTGYTGEELCGKRFTDLLSIGSRLFHQTHWMPLLQLQGSVAEVQLELVDRRGRVLAVLVNAARRGGEGSSDVVDIALFVATDRRKYERELLHARKRAEELLESEREAQDARARAEARLRLALESASLRVWSVDVPTGARSYGSDVGALLGRPDGEEVTADEYASCIHPEDRELEAAAFLAAVDPVRRARYSVEYRLLGLDGVERIIRSTGGAFFDPNGRPLQFSGVLEDVTDRRRAEESIRQRELEFRTLAENSPDVIVRFDRERRYVYMNPAGERISGSAAGAFIGKRLDETRLGSDVVARWTDALDAAFAGRPAVFAFSYSRDGGAHELQASIVPERSVRGEIATALAIVRDVSVLRRQEREAKQRAILAEQLIGIVSHDLRNPLNAVLLGTHLLQSEELGKTEARVVTRIASAAERANRLIADLLDFTQARLGGGLRVDRRELDLHVLANECIDELKLAWPGRKLEHRRSGHGFALGDPDRLAQVVTNLAANALTYGTPDDAVTIATSIEDAIMEIRVHNTGRPIPPDLQEHLFEPMRRGEHQVKLGSRSVGLGLYIVREIATAHGGDVHVRSSEAEGTTFVVSLPRAAAPAARAPSVAPSALFAE